MSSLISQRIKISLEKSKLTQSDIVKRTGINKGALSSYISGRYAPKYTNICKLAKVFNVSVEWLMGMEE